MPRLALRTGLVWAPCREYGIHITRGRDQGFPVVEIGPDELGAAPRQLVGGSRPRVPRRDSDEVAAVQQLVEHGPEPSTGAYGKDACHASTLANTPRGY